MIKIALSGKMRSGKSTVVEQLCQWAFDRLIVTETIAISDSIKEMATNAFGKYSRKMLQIMGDDFREILWVKGIPNGRDLWINLCLKRVRDLPHDTIDLLLCDGVRYPNELKPLRKEGFKIFRLLTNGELQLSRQFESNKKTEGLDCTGETALDEFEGKDFFDREFESHLSTGEITQLIIEEIYGKEKAKIAV